MSNRDRMLTKIERVVELEYDQLDRRLMKHEITQDQYDDEARAIDEWARDMYNDMDR
jgi:hypothetical protein